MIHRIVNQQARVDAVLVSRIPFKRLVDELSMTVRPKTAESYRSLMRHLHRFLGHEPLLCDMTRVESCLAFTDWLLKRVQPSSARTYLNKLYALLKKATRKGYCRFNPSDYDELKLPRSSVKDPSFLTANQVLALEKAPCPHESTKRAFLFAVHTGLRLSDIETLEWQHIRHHCGQLMIVKEQVKTGRIVRVPLNDKAKALYQLQARGNRGRWVFDLYSRSTIATDLKIWSRNAGLDVKLTFHMSRHTFVTILLQSDISIYMASRLCGHTKVSTTERYAHLTDSLYGEATKSMNDYWSAVRLE